VEVHQARNLLPGDFPLIGAPSSDPYAKVRARGGRQSHSDAALYILYGESLMIYSVV
jgi:hypothetical protein